MKKYLSLLTAILFISSAMFAQTVSLTTSPLAASDIAQGTTNNIVYAVRMDVAASPVTVNSIQFTVGGTHDNNDLTVFHVYFNTTAPTLSGAFFVAANIPATFAAPHTYNTSTVNQTIAAGGSGYFIIVVNTSSSATSGNTVKINGLTDPVSFGYTTSPTITNNQTDAAGTQTILAAGVTLTTSPLAASNIAQGTTNNIVYAVRMDVASLPVTVSSIQFTLSGTHDNNDLTVFHVYFNTTAPTLSGAFFVAANIPATFAAPHTYNTVMVNQTIAAGGSGYFIIVVNTSSSATSGNTVKINGLTDPVSFGYTTSPTITNNQTDAAGAQTILAAGVTLTTSPLAASNIAQGTSNNIVYAVRMDVASLPATVNSIQFTLGGTHDNDDLTVFHVYFNTTAPTLSGAFFLGANYPATFAAPHTYNVTFNVAGTQTIAAGGSGYFIIVVNTSSSATSGNTVKINGLTDPVSFGYTTSPTITNNQTDAAGAQTILAAGVTLTTSSLAASNMVQGTSDNIVYAVRMDVTSLPVTVNSIQFTLSGTHDNNDLTVFHVYFNTTAPTLSGAFFVAANIPATFAAPHTYNTSTVNQTIAAGGSGYFIIVVNTSSSATSGNTVKINGLTDPVSFGFTTTPPVSNNQTDIAGVQTISGTLPLTLLHFTGNIFNKKEVQLRWETGSEINTKDFEVEWSEDGLHFIKIAVLQAAGNSTEDLHYNYLHKMPVDGNNYYRLKMRDKDGRFTYSPVIRMIVSVKDLSITVFPNPVADLLQLHLVAVKNETISLTLYNADGKMIGVKQFFVLKGSNRFNWDLQSVPAGNYFISSPNDLFKTIQVIKVQ